MANKAKNKAPAAVDLALTHGMGYKLHTMTLFPDPESAFSVGTGLFGNTIIFDLILTFMVIKPDFSHDVTVIAGHYYNLCVALDYFPANYIAAIGYHFVQAAWWWSCFRFCARARIAHQEKLISHELLMFTRVSGLIFSCLTPVMLLCLMRKPMLTSVDSLIFHVRGFEAQITGAAVWVFAQWVFTVNVVSRHKPYLAQYTAIVAVFITASYLKCKWHQDTIHKWASLEHPELAHAESVWTYITSWPQLNDWVWVATMPMSAGWSPLKGWSPVGDYFEEARAVGAHESDYPPYVKVPAENEAKNAALAQELAQDFVAGLKVDIKEDEANLQEWGNTAGMARATFEITEEGLQMIHPDLRCGLLAKPAKYDAIIRMNITILGTVRMSTRLFLPDSVPVTDLLKANLPSYVLAGKQPGGQYAPVPTNSPATGDVPKVIDMPFAEDLKEFLAPSGESLCALKKIMYTDTGCTKICRALQWARTLLGMAKQMGICNERTYPGDVFSALGLFGKSYYGGLPFRLGPGACKWGIRPCQEHNIGPGPSILPVMAKPTPYDIFREAAKIAADRFIPTADSFLAKGDAKFDFKVQVCTHFSKHDLYTANAIWDEDTSPYLTVGSLTIHKGQKLDKLQKEIGGDGLLFDVWNAYKENRPVGPLNNARHAVYEAHGGERMRSSKTCPVMGRVSPA